MRLTKRRDNNRTERLDPRVVLGSGSRRRNARGYGGQPGQNSLKIESGRQEFCLFSRKTVLNQTKRSCGTPTHERFGKGATGVRVVLEIYAENSQPERLKIPLESYNAWIQAAVYHLMGRVVANVVHDQGFLVDGRRMRLFTFSRLLGAYHVRPPWIEFALPVRLVVSSPLTVLVQQFTNAIAANGVFRLGPYHCEIHRVSLHNFQTQSDSLDVRTLAPITSHSTLIKEDGVSRYTVYFHPQEKEFSELVTKNLLRKYRAIYAIPWPDPAARVTVVPRSAVKFDLVRYKNTVIKGYSGRFQIRGPAPLLQVGYDAGFGDRNSQGFGLTEVTLEASRGR